MNEAMAPEVDDRLAAFVEASFRLLRERCPEHEAPKLRHETWVRRPGDRFVRSSEPLPWWRDCLFMHIDALQRLPEADSARAAVRADPAIGPQLDKLVGTGLGAHLATPYEALLKVLLSVAAEQGSFVFEPTAANAAIQKVLAEMRRPDFDVLLLAPLLGLRTPSEKGSIRGVMETEIGRMTDGEIISSLHWGMLSYPMSDVVMHVPYASAIRVRGKLKRLIGDPTRGLAWGEATEWEEAAHARIDEVLDSFRVFKPGRIRHAGAMLFMSGWPVSGALDWPGFSAVRGISGSTRPFMHWPADYELASDEMGRFVSFCAALDKARRKRLIDVAVRRFSYALERDRPDDTLIDLVIAAESLFLGDAGDPQERGELRFRFSLRAAFFLAPDIETRKRFFQFMRNAYDARSALVHGGEPDPRLFRVFGQDLTLEQFIERLASELRKALHRAVEIRDAGSGGLLNWDELVLRGGGQ